MNESQTFFSVIIPTWNRAGYIAKTLDSVLQQDYTVFEILVVDDGSTDNTQAVVQSINDKRIRYIRQENSERAAARNNGVRHAKGEFVTFLDSDDLLKNNHLRVANEFIRRNPRADFFHQGYDVIKPDGSVIYRWKNLPDPANKKMAEGNFLSCLGVFVKRSVMEEHPFNEDRELSGSEDYELWIRLSSRFTLRTVALSTACLVNHEARSVLNINREKFSKRISLAKKYLSEDVHVVDSFKSELNALFAYLDLYEALHLAISDNKKFALTSWHRSLKTHPAIILNYRFWVVLKKLLFK
jgi:glycosyltransferase involved in cell wall biosynthesis